MNEAMAHNVDLSIIKKYASETLIRDSLCVDAYLIRGDIYLADDSTKLLALRDFDKVILIDSTNKYAYFKSALACYDLEMYKEALRRFKRTLILKSAESNRIIIDNSDKFSSKQNNNVKYDVAAQEIYFNFAITLLNTGNLDLALDYMNLCISENYELSESYFIRALIHLEMNNKMEACDDFNTAKFLGSKDAISYLEENCK
ncbi:MAG: tetratricopeptide repeat protein [Agriterribacter sp.]